MVFDAAFILSTLLLPLGIADLDRVPSDERLAALLGAAVVTQIAGASIKDRFLDGRLAPREESMPGLAGGFMKLLLFFHFLLFTVAILLGLTLAGVYRPEGSASFFRGDVWIGIALLLGAITTGVVYGASVGSGANRPGASGEPPEEKRPWLEYVGDAFLLLSAWILTWLFWELLIVADLEAVRGIGFSGRGITLLVVTSLLFVFFYLPARYLFLVEDYQSPFTWLRVWLAMWPVYLTIIGG